MGLSTTHGCWRGSYPFFNRFRRELARAAGYRVPDDEDAYVELDWQDFGEGNFFGEWDEPPEDVLLVLLIHSDCEGMIPARFCDALARRILLLLPKLESFRVEAALFAAGLLRAGEAGERVEFH